MELVIGFGRCCNESQNVFDGFLLQNVFLFPAKDLQEDGRRRRCAAAATAASRKQALTHFRDAKSNAVSSPPPPTKVHLISLIYILGLGFSSFETSNIQTIIADYFSEGQNKELGFYK